MRLPAVLLVCVSSLAIESTIAKNLSILDVWQEDFPYSRYLSVCLIVGNVLGLF